MQAKVAKILKKEFNAAEVGNFSKHYDTELLAMFGKDGGMYSGRSRLNTKLSFVEFGFAPK